MRGIYSIQTTISLKLFPKFGPGEIVHIMHKLDGSEIIHFGYRAFNYGYLENVDEKKVYLY